MRLLTAIMAMGFAAAPITAFAQGAQSSPVPVTLMRPPQTPAERTICINALRGYRLGGNESLKLRASIMYLAMKNAQEDPKGKALTERFLEILSELQDQPLPNPTEAEPTVQRCYDADPLASGDQIQPLPANAFKRDLMCRATILLILQSTQRLGDTPERARLVVVQKRFEDRTGPQRYYDNGLRTQEAMNTSVIEAMTTSLAVGTTYAIANACAALP